MKPITIILLSLIFLSVFFSGCIFYKFETFQKYDVTIMECYLFCENFEETGEWRHCSGELYNQNQTHGLCVCQCMRGYFE